ncbi:MAG: hypothetical protein GY765_31415, partial [bacterium]|nr:hypothetical protein [bacterium]
MVIREKGYHSWKGDLKQTGMNWLPIFTNGIKSVARKKWAKLIFFICSSISLIFALGVYASSRPEIKALAHMMEGLSKDLTSDASIFNL